MRQGVYIVRCVKVVTLCEGGRNETGGVVRCVKVVTLCEGTGGVVRCVKVVTLCEGGRNETGSVYSEVCESGDTV